MRPHGAIRAADPRLFVMVALHDELQHVGREQLLLQAVQHARLELGAGDPLAVRAGAFLTVS
ncbi:hypothetical protein [Sphingomonas vulcanisoli]|uniref:hypothetical protein n=1 Tax=Sphingomonas vulcanisoli TaxID=1658060 RepID=UPI001FBB5D25|nr:hypothetical protein [Sphingomonas vulcanisoli]